MRIQKVRGIVLSSVVYGEGDVIATLLTEDSGKRSFSFKGLKRSRRRPHAAADPGSLVQLSCYYKEGRDILSAGDISLEQEFAGVRNSLGRIYAAHIMLETVEKSLGRDSPERPLFKLLEAALKALNDTAAPCGLTVFFLVHLLRAHGIFPSMTDCALCRTGNFGDFILRRADLHPVCLPCAAGNGILLKAAVRQYLELCISKKYYEIDCMLFNENDTCDLLVSILNFIEGHYGVTIQSGKRLSVDNSNIFR